MNRQIWSAGLAMIVVACGNDAVPTTASDAPAEVGRSSVKAKQAATPSETVLCKINGVEWAYSEASGVVSVSRQSGARRARLTFQRQLERGSEAVQLEFNVDTGRLDGVLMNLKRPGKQGGLVGASYTLYPDTLNHNPNTFMEGEIALAEEELLAAGQARFAVANQYEIGALRDESDHLVQVSDLKFANVPYSDIAKTFGQQLRDANSD